MYYNKHIFFCTNIKKNGSGCGEFNSDSALGYVKKQLKDNDLWGKGKIRASKSGCLGRCELAPVCVIYPDNVWYTYVDEDDLSEIVSSHLINNKIVERLLLNDN